MERSLIYNGTITAEQFLFYEIRIASKYYLDGTSVEDAIEEIKKNNLFQYPTERLVARMVRSCYKRLDALDDEQLRQELSSAPPEIAKQINLYAMATDAASGWVLDEMEEGRPVPAASDRSTIHPDSPDGFVNILVLDMNAYEERYGNKAVRKNLTIPAWLNTFAETNHVNFSQVLQDALISMYQRQMAKR